MDILNLTKEQSLELLDLRKKEVNVLCLEKPELKGLTSRVAVVLDYSSSMNRLYKDGTVQAVLERLFPLALQFDDNGEMEFWIFDDGFHRLENINMDNYYGYIEKNVYKMYHMGCTCYAPVLKDIQKKYIKEDPAKMPNYIIFITDGNNSDAAETTKIIREMSSDPIFIQFVGIGNQRFSFLERLDNLGGRVVDNANFFQIRDINELEDRELYNLLLKEYPQWLGYKQVKAMIEKQGKKGFFSKLFR